MSALAVEAPRTLNPREHRSYSCMYCNHGWAVDDPNFNYYEVLSYGKYAGELADGREGRPRRTLGWFSHCADREACAERARNNKAGLAHFQLALEVT